MQDHLAYAVVGLVLIILIAYAPSLSGEFVHLDDYQYVVDNQPVRQPGWASVARFFSEVRKPSTVDGYYQPLTMTSLMIDAWLAGGQGLVPFVYHLTNVLLHAATCVLLMFMVRAAVGGVAVPLLVALLFAVHPVQVESVAWISQRKTVLSALLTVGCIVCYLKHGRSRGRGSKDSRVQGSDGRAPPSPRVGGGRSWLIASVLLYCAGGLAKPTVMLLPLVLPLLDAWPLRRRPAPVLVEKLPFLVFMVPMAWVAWTSQASSSAQLLAPSFASLGALAKSLGLVCYNLMLYLGNVFWPMSLSPYREIPADLSLGNAAILFSMVGAIVLAAVCLSAYRWSKPLLVGSVAFVIMLAPALGAVRFAETCVADRFCYLPTVFLLLPLAALITRIEVLVPRRVVLIRVCFGLFAIPLLLLMRGQQAIWHDSRALWTHVVETAPNLAKGHAQLAAQELDAGAFHPALLHARRALEIAPQDAGYMHVLGRAFVRNSRAQEAVAIVKQAIAKGLGPIEPLARVSLAEALIATGDVEGARAACEQAIAMGRGEVSTYTMLGDAAYNWAERYDVAADYYRKALERDPDNITTRQFLGRALEYCNRDADALREYERIFDICAQRGTPVPTYLRHAAEEVRRRLNRPTTQSTER